MKKPDTSKFYRYFFYLFLFSIPLQTRKVFLTEHSFYTGSFTEYGTIFLYLSDILLFLAFVSLIIFNTNHFKNGLSELNNKSSKIGANKIFIAMAFLIVWSFISTIVNQSYLEVSLFRSLKLAEMILLVFFIFSTFREKRFLSSSLLIIAITGFFQSFLAIYQFVYQKSLFTSPLLHRLTGETILSPTLPGIAKIGNNGEKLLRAYGTFPHPNLLGGFLVFTFFISLYLYLCHKDEFLSRSCLRFHKFDKGFIRCTTSTLWIILFSFQLLALVLSFSRSAWIGFMISAASFVYFLVRYTKIVSRETIFNDLKHRYKELSISILLLLSLVVGNLSLVSGRLSQDVSINGSKNSQATALPQNDTFTDRAFFNNVSRETISQNPLFGSGPGTAIFQIETYLRKTKKTKPIESWQYQPPHNIYLLVASELGIIGLLIILLIAINSVKHSLSNIVSRETIINISVFQSCTLSIMFSFLIIGCFDHYLWTLQQGQLIFWLIVGLLLI